MYANPDIDESVEKNLFNYQNLDLDAMVQYFLRMPKIDISPLLPQIQAHTLALARDRDPIVPPDESRKIASFVPGAELAMIPDAGHVPFLERPKEYCAVLSSWLEKTGLGE
jgi:pimeloyl-ACP methyl ester carboxylesterase